MSWFFMPSTSLYLLSFVLGAVGIVLFISNIYAAVSGGPFAATPRSVIHRALGLANLRAGEKFYDIGSGNGRVLLAAAKDFGADAVGFELSLLQFFASKLNIFFHGNPPNVRVHLKNFFGADIRDADVVFCWLPPRTLRRLKNKFERELKPGTRVVTYSSPLGFWEPKERVVVAENGLSLFFYVKE